MAVSLLAIDCCHNSGSIALLDEAGRRRRVKLPAVRGLAEHLIPSILKLLVDCGQQIADLDAIIVTRGPGSFTGVRTGLAVAKGLALAAELPVFGVTTLQLTALRALVEPHQTFWVALDGRRGKYFVQFFNGLYEPLTSPASMNPDDFISQAECNTIIISDINFDKPDLDVRSTELEHTSCAAELMLDFARTQLQNGGIAIKGCELTPLYLRQPDARPSAGLSLFEDAS